MRTELVNNIVQAIKDNMPDVTKNNIYPCRSIEAMSKTTYIDDIYIAYNYERD